MMKSIDIDDINKEIKRQLCNVYIDGDAIPMALTQDQINLLKWLQKYFEIECVEIDQVITI